MLKGREIVLGFLLASAVWAIVAVLQSDSSAYYQICEYNQYADKDNCTSHHLLYIVFWYGGYVINSATITALATLAIARFTLTLKKSTDRLWDAGERQLKLTRETFVLRERPYVFIFGVKNIEPGQTEHLDGLVPYVVANHGQAPAVIERVEYCVAAEDKPGETGPAWDDHPLVVSPILGIGASVACKANSVAWLDSGNRITDMADNKKKWAIPEIKIKGTTWFVRIKIFYRGPFSAGHETGGCSRYDLEPCQFVQYGGQEYNYTK